MSTAAKVHDYFGYGAWEAYGAGRVTIGVSDDYTIGSEGGEARHILTESEIPSHSHMTAKGERSASASWLMDQYQTYQAESNIVPGHYWCAYTMSAGGGHSHNNMQPYRTVYRWRRIA